MNGIGIMVIMVIVGLLLVQDLAWRFSINGVPGIRTSTSEGTEPQTLRAVRYSEPHEIVGSEARLVKVHAGEDFYDSGYSGLGSQYSRDPLRGPVVNVIFLQPDQSVHVLLDRPARIHNVDYPSKDSDPRPWIAYRMAVEDTNGNGYLDSFDRTDLYVSGLSGEGLHRVLDDGYEVQSIIPVDGGTRMLIYAYDRSVAPSRQEQQPQVAFVYDPATRRLEQHDSLNDAVLEISRILGQ